MIAGGDGTGTTKSAELFIPSTGQSCSLPGLPDKRSYHTMDTVDGIPTLCGGCCSPGVFSTVTEKSCLQFSPLSSSGTWKKSLSLMRTRQNHASWTSCAGLVLIGGGPYFHRTGDPLPDAELVTKDSSFAGFSLTFDIRWEFLSSLDWEAATMCKLKGQSSNMRTY